MQPLKKTKLVILQGEMVEWSITTVLKTVVPRGTGGSNPSLSAKSCKSKDLQDFFIIILACPSKRDSGFALAIELDDKGKGGSPDISRGLSI